MMVFCSDNTLFTRSFGVSVINKQVMSGNLLKLGVKQLKQTKFGHSSTPKVNTRCIFNPQRPHHPLNR